MKKGRILREIEGVIAVLEISKGQKLSEALKIEVTAFYESDEVCPGRKDGCS